MQTKISQQILNAMNIRKQFEEKIENDTAKPKCHFSSPSGLLLDVWGGIYKDKRYHLFYDTNYDNDPRRMAGAVAHLVSKDMINWQELPFALVPEEEKRGELNLNDGFIVMDKQDEPLMFYTRCFVDPKKNREHVAVRGSDDMLLWERINDGDAVLTMDNHGGPVFLPTWSDVVLFNKNGRTFMIISKCTHVDDKQDMIPIYEAVDDTLLKWEYRGVFLEQTGECINFVKIKDKWVLIYSPFDNPQYFVGSFDINTYKFNVEKQGTLSYGYVSQGCKLYDISRGFYATSTFKGEYDNTYIIGWISGFIDTMDWNGCVSYPRMLDLDEQNNLIMKPHSALNNLRKEEVTLQGATDLGRSFELDITAQLKQNEGIEICVQDSFNLQIKNNHFKFNDIEFDFDYGDSLNIKMYVDVTVAEIFLCDGKVSVSRCFEQIKVGEPVLVKTDGKITKAKAYKF